MGRKALSPDNSARLRMLAYCLKIHHVRSVACVDALKSTQAWPGRYSRASISILVLHFDFSCALFSTEPHFQVSEALMELAG